MHAHRDNGLIGSRIGSYEVTRMLGEGGMGAVYEIVHPGIGKRLALKLLKAEFAGKPDIVRRFFDEARSVNLIGHPNIVDILDFSQLPDGRPYLTMEFLEGEDLTALLHRTGPLAAKEALELLTPVCSALAAAHRAGITHRDLKPDNLFVDTRGAARRVVVLDFGIAKLAPDLASGDATATGMLLGTPAYMAPEQATGQSRMIGPWTDVYALGCIAYHMLTGRPPFTASTLAELIAKQAYDEPAPLTSHRPELGVVVEGVIMRALAKETGARFADAGAFAAALERAVHAPPQAVAPGGIGEVTATARSLVASLPSPRPISPSPPTAAAAPPQPVAAAPTPVSEPTRAPAGRQWLIPALSIAMLAASAVAVYFILTN